MHQWLVRVLKHFTAVSSALIVRQKILMSERLKHTSFLSVHSVQKAVMANW